MTLTRRSFIAASAAVPLLRAQQTSSTDIGPVAWWVKQAYIQAWQSEGRIGYVNRSVFSGLASSLQYLQYKTHDWGLGDLAAQGAARLPYSIDHVNPLYAKRMANNAQMAIPPDFFSLVGLSTVAIEAGITWPTLNSGQDLDYWTDQAIGILQQYANGDYARLRHGVHLERARFELVAASASKDAVLVTAGGTLMVGGLACLNSAGGLGVLTGAIIPVAGALGVAAAWTGVGLFVLGAALVIYVSYRLLTQQGTSDSPWTKPKDMPRNDYLTHWNGASVAVLYPPTDDTLPVPDVWSRVCYPACQ